MTKFENIDLVLGAASERFFGEGYQHVDSRVRDARITPDTVDAICDVRYASSWSTRAGIIRTDIHLSTLDVLTLACRVVEIGLPPEAAAVSVTQLSVRASNRPLTVLTGISVHATRQPGTPHFEIHIGSMAVNLSLSSFPNAFSTDLTSLQFSAGWQPLSDARIELANVVISVSDRFASANIAILARSEAVWKLDSRAPRLSVADTVASAAALTQALLYSLDGVERSEVGNFWMKRASLRFSESHSIQSANQTIDVEVNRTRLLSLHGKSWRTARVHVSTPFGADIDADVAYELSGRSQDRRSEPKHITDS